MPLSPEQEALCERLEKGESTPNAAALIRQLIQEEMEQLRAIDARQHSQLKKTG